MSRLKVVVVFGGRSVEREVSRISARTIVGALDPVRYEVIALAVDKDGHFLSTRESGKLLETGEGRKATGEGRAEAETGSPAAIVPVEIKPGSADVVFPIVHGATGEDGVLQGFLEMLGAPCVGAGVTASAVAMDKSIFKALLRDAGIPTPRSLTVGGFRISPHPGPLPPGEGADAPHPGPFPWGEGEMRSAGMGLPLFVKPANGGSSVGVTKVKRWQDLPAAIDDALRYDERALVEEAIDARELECAVLGNEEPRASGVGEIVPSHEFYDYDDKYREDKAQLLIPAPVPAAVSQEVRRLALDVFRLCGASGMARVDFFLERGSNRVLVNELNTLPGFTPISMYPKLWEAAGMSLPALLDELIRLALERKEKRDRLSREPPAELR